MALRLAQEIGAEIVSVDSMQVYRGMDVGTAKPTPSERMLVPHRMIDLVEPESTFTVSRFQEVGRHYLTGGAPIIIVGGSGLHFRALVDPMTFAPFDQGVREDVEAIGTQEARRRLLDADPDAGTHVDLENPRRVARALEVLLLTGNTPSMRATSVEARAVAEYRAAVPFRAVGLDPGIELERRVRRRFERMLADGLFDEVARLTDRLGPTASQAVGYKQLIPAVRGEVSLGDATESAIRATLALAKRQRTYFRRDPRIRWVPWESDMDGRMRRVRHAFEERDR